MRALMIACEDRPKSPGHIIIIAMIATLEFQCISNFQTDTSQHAQLFHLIILLCFIPI